MTFFGILLLRSRVGMLRLNSLLRRPRKKDRKATSRGDPAAGAATGAPKKPNMPAELEGLQCPYTWPAPPMDADKIDYNRDSMGLSGTGWTLVMDKLDVAYGMLHAGRQPEGRALLVDLYALLLPFRCFSSGSDVVSDYKQALRHMLDGTWIGMEFSQLDRNEDDACEDVREASLMMAFLQSVTPYDRLPPRQQAAVLATQAVITGDPSLLRKSMAQSPSEGQWPFHLGVMLQRTRAEGVVGASLFGGRPGAEELSLLRQAYRLARAPEAGLKLAKSLAGTAGREGHHEAKRLADEALNKYPDNVAVTYQAACVLLDVRVGKESRLRARAEALFRRCEALLGRPCASLHMDLCLLMCEQGRREEARLERDEALHIDRAAICRGGDPPHLDTLEMSNVMKTIFQ